MRANGDPKRGTVSASRSALRLGAVVAAALVVCNFGCQKSDRDQVLIASMTDNVELLKQMDARGADLNAQYPERFYWTPLMTAIYFDSTNVIPYLVNRGVDLAKRSRVGGGETALMMAIGSDDTNTVKLLFQKAPQVLSQTEDWPAVRSLTQAAGGDQAVRRYLLNLVDEFLKTNPPPSSKP
jgi:ankyrin repeat protein